MPVRRHARRTVAAVVAAALLGLLTAVVAPAPAAALTTDPGGFNAVGPTRLLDTRRSGQGPCLTGARTLTVAGAPGVPADAAAATLNVTVVAPSSAGFVSVWPTGSARPTVSNVNYARGQTVAGAVAVPVGVGGAVEVFASSGCPHVVVDAGGSFAPGSPTGAGGFAPVPPARLLDTRRSGQGPCVGSSRRVQVAGRFGVPGDAVAATLNLTAVTPSTGGHLTVFPTGTAPPTTSTVNFVAGGVVANSTTARLGSDGSVTVTASGGCPHLVVDVAGGYAAGSPVVAGGFTPVAPNRLLDTRQAGQGPCVAGSRTLTVAGRAGVPVGAGAVTLNVTAVGATSGGFVTVHPSGSPRPTASSLNFAAGRAVPNSVTVKLGAGGAVEVFADAGCPHLVVDVGGWYSASGRNEQPVVGSFAANLPSAAAPALLAVSWSVSDPEGDLLTCTLDTDGNGTFETTVAACQNQGSRLASLTGAGRTTLRLRVDDGTSAPVVATTVVDVTAGTSETFDIVLRGADGLSPAVRAAFAAAEARWEAVVVRGQPDLFVDVTGPECGSASVPGLPDSGFTGVVDDLVVDVAVGPVDGPSGTLAVAGPCDVTSDGRLPHYGLMLFDSADVDPMLTAGTLADVVTHEMGHVLGFGTWWTQGGRSLVSGAGTVASRFTGARARAAWSALGRTGDVPLETGGGDGTADSHWSEAVFGNELMTGFVGRSNPMSAVTIASLADLGYQVDVRQAQAFTLAGLRAARAAGAAPAGTGAAGFDEPLAPL